MPNMKQVLNPADAALALPPAGKVLKKYWKILRVSLIERLVYRADFIVSTIFRFLPLLTSFLLWDAVYESSGKADLSGFSRAA